MFSKGVIKNDSDQSDTEYEENIEERIKFKKQRLSETERKEQYMNNDLFKKYFKYQSPNDMHKQLNKTKNIETNKIRVNLIKSSLINFKKTLEIHLKMM